MRSKSVSDPFTLNADDEIKRISSVRETPRSVSHLVVVSSGRQQLVVSAPLQSAHFLSVALQAALGLQRRRSDVPLQDQPVPAARRQLIHVPRQRT